MYYYGRKSGQYNKRNTVTREDIEVWSTIYSNGKNWIKGNVELFLAFTGMIGILLAAGNQAVIWPAIQWNVLAILMCLMLILGGLRQAGGIQWVCYHLLRRCHSVKAVCAFFIFSCFISSMVITNDASLLLFVPESIWLFRKLKKDDWLPFLVVLETIAANMGSTLLPSGNPQNLYLYFMYGMKFSDFLKITVPITALSGLLLLGILWGRRNEAMALPQQKAPAVRGRQAALFTFLLGVIFLVLLKTLVWWVAAMVVIPLAVFLDYRLLKQVDWKLLFLFICLFVFAGNMSHMPWVIRHLTGNPLLQGVFWSQVISNVPAAVLLSSVNTQGEMLVAGTDIGGLGTLIASMASLISYRAYKQYAGRNIREYLVIFTAWNLLFLAVLLLEAWLIF